MRLLPGAPALLFVAGLALAAEVPQGDAQRGERLAGLGGCVACHTAEGGVPLAGGHVLHTDQGDFVGPNLTPDPEHGLGRWTFEDFERAMRRGRDPEGRALWPAFPYPAFTRLDARDLADLWAWLRQVEPVARPDDPQQPARGLSRALLGLWRTLYFHPRAALHEPELPADAARGRELVEGLGHCGGCHTARTATGGPRAGAHLAGSRQPPSGGPNLTPHADGLGGWTSDEVRSYLTDGLAPDGDVAGGEMARVIREGTSRLSDADLRAIVAYLRALPPRPDAPAEP